MRDEKPLAFQLKSLDNEIKRLLDPTAIAENHANLTGMQYAIIGFLGLKNNTEDVYQRDIEKEFNIRRSTASSMVIHLEKEGYLYRIGVPDDARLKKIVLTEKALDLDKKAREHIMQIETQLMKGITKEEIEQFYSVLEKIQNNAKQ